MTEDKINSPAEPPRPAQPRYVERAPAGQQTATPKPAENVAALKHDPTASSQPGKPKEVGGPKGPEPTRFGDWERDGRCVDF
ncbi:MAG: DUF1674 domain-containing protein [Alphaproteobacteria bacterium]